MPEQPIKLDEIHRDLLLPQIDAFLAVAPDSGARADYQALREAIAAGEVPDLLAERLGAITEVLLSSGRVRAAHGPGAELALWSMLQKTPRGRALIASVASVNAALKPLEGQPLEFVSVTARGPGAYSLTLKNADVNLVVRFEAAGVRVESVEV
jgi:hypothetical protein